MSLVVARPRAMWIKLNLMEKRVIIIRGLVYPSRRCRFLPRSCRCMAARSPLAK